MSTTRITFTIDEVTLAELRDRVAPGKVSEFVVEAVRHKLRIDPIKELLQQLDAMYGPLTEDQLTEGAECYDQVKQRLSTNGSDHA